MARPTRPLVWHQLRFALPLAQDTAVGLVERVLADGSLGRVVLELRAAAGQAVWAVGSQAGERLVSVVRELVPGCRVSRGFSRRAVDQAVVVSARPVGAGLATERLSAVVRAVLAALAVTAEDEELVVQLQLGRRFAPQALGRVEPQGWLELLGLVPIPSLRGERGRRMRVQVGRHRAGASLRLGVRAASPLRQRVLLQGLLGALRLVEGPGVRLRARTEHPAKLDGVRRPWRPGLELGAGEIVSMAGWPIGELPLPLLGSGHPRLVAPPPEVASGSSQRVVGTGAVPGETGLVRLPITDAVYHTHLLGPTGVGKSTVLLSLALADAAEGRGLLLLDPKGDLATDFLARLPQERVGDVVVLENTRCNKGEKKDDEALAKKYAALCDVYVNDAFGTAHRAEASTHGIARFAKEAAAGPLLAAELDALGKALHNPAHPMVAIVAGSKVSTKLTILDSLADKVDQLIVGGGIANTFMLAAGLPIGKSLAEPDLVGDAKKIIEKMKARGAEVPIPEDVVVAKTFAADAPATVKAAKDVAEDDMILDIGPKTAAKLAEQLKSAGTIVWNGPVGVFEFDAFAKGTETLARAIAASKGFSIAGGGDTLAAIAKFGITDQISYISTGGGAFLEFLEGRTLPAVAALEAAAG